ncbi:unnamed protein product [Sympodiomycopsis kandeliae]
MEDPAEIAALCQEYIALLDNVSQEVTHALKEIQHKDTKVQELIPKIASREAQLRELLNKGSPGAPVSAGGVAGSAASAQAANLTEQDRIKADKLVERIRSDYRRADEWSSHKEALSKALWRNIWGHNERLQETLGKISPALMSTAESNVAASTAALPMNPTSASQGSAILGAISAAFGTSGPGGLMPGLAGFPGATSNGALGSSNDSATASGLKRKAPGSLSLAPAASSPLAPSSSGSQNRPLASTPQGKNSRANSAERLTPGGAGANTPGGYQAETPSRGYNSPTQTYGSSSSGRPRKLGHKSRSGAPSGLANVFSADDSSRLSLLSGDHESGTSGPGGGDNGEDEKDENLYCFCQKVSYGEMIGCDSDDCQYEWFHLDCVGLSKPLPQVWYCSDCQARMKLKDSTGTKETPGVGEKDTPGPTAKAIKKEGSVGPGSGGSVSGDKSSNKRRKKG